MSRSTKMASAALGANISPVEVTNISQYGFWLLLNEEELCPVVRRVSMVP
jgi:hypothetical protein